MQKFQQYPRMAAMRCLLWSRPWIDLRALIIHAHGISNLIISIYAFFFGNFLENHDQRGKQSVKNRVRLARGLVPWRFMEFGLGRPKREQNTGGQFNTPSTSPFNNVLWQNLCHLLISTLPRFMFTYSILIDI